MPKPQTFLGEEQLPANLGIQAQASNSDLARLGSLLTNVNMSYKSRNREQTKMTGPTSSYGVVIIDDQKQVKLMNPAAQAYLAQLTEADIDDVLNYLGQQVVDQLLTPPTEGQATHEIILAGPPRQVFEVMAQSLGPDPPVNGWVLIIQDVTTLQSRQVQQLRPERLDAVGQLAAGTAHYFNNILTSIIGFAELLVGDPDISPTAQQDLGRIIQEGERGARLVRQILDFAGKSTTNKQFLDLAIFLPKLIKSLHATLSPNVRIEWEIEPDREEFGVYADPAQMRQVLINLVTNAYEAMPAGGLLQFRLFTLTLKPDQPASWFTPSSGELEYTMPLNWVALSITDTGVGIPSDRVAFIFDPFFTTKEIGQGLGLGLAQAYGLIKQHQGHIDVNSQVGAGTTLTIYLPWLSSVTASTSTQDIPRGHGETILVVDEEAAVLDVVKNILEYLDYHVLTVSSATQALEVYKQRQDEIVLVLTELDLPDIEGIVLAQILIEIKVTKIVALANYISPTEADKLRQQGLIVDWLRKPIGLKNLADVVGKALQK